MEHPHVLFPGFHHEGPIVQQSSRVVPTPLGWGGYGSVQEDVRDPPGQRRFIPLYSRRAERWETIEPTPVPLLRPNTDCGFSPVMESDLIHRKVKKAENTNPRIAGVSLNFSKQIGRFCWDQSGIAFQSMGRLLEPHYYLGEKGKVSHGQTKMTATLQCLQNAPYHECPFPHSSYPIRALSFLTGDWLQDVPPTLLAQLVDDGMADEWKQLQFQESLTGGALSWAPYPGGSGGCLIYPRGAAMNQLHFQQILMKPSRVKIKGKPAVYDLQQRVLQIGTGEFDDIFVGVRSAYNLATWSFSADDPPRPLGVVRTKTPSTCLNVSPHLPGELCVCTESGTLYLWNLERGLQRIRQDEETLFFRDDSHWRWSDFTSHPRVLLYADRTGVQAADVRVEGGQGLDLFRIGQESSAQRGERVILSRCLRETESAHFLVTTQFSVYIMDDRFPLVPLAKWTHMLERPPAFVSVIPGGPTERTNKILLGTQHSQERVLLQYSGGDVNPCQLHLPAVRLPQNSESLHHLDPLQPHQREIVAQRLASPMAGLAAACTVLNPEFLMLFHLTEAGDVFTQRLVYKNSPAPSSNHFSGRNPSCTVERTVPSGTPTEQISEAVTIELDTSGQDPESGLIPGAVECSPETVSTNGIDATSPVYEVMSSSPPSFSTKSKLSFSKWIHRVLKICKGSVEELQRPGCQINKLFSAEELRETPQEVDRLRDCLRQGMRTGKLIQLGSTTRSETVELVHAEKWKDPLSQRLTAAWEGRLKLLWDDHKGLNKVSKMQALREKRRRQKLQRAQSQSSLTGSLLSSFSFRSGTFETEASSPWSYDSAPVSDVDTSIYSAVSEKQGNAVSIEQISNCSFQSGPSTRPDLFRVRQAQANLNVSDSKLSESCPIISSQSLRSKGIPKERRRTLQDFMTFFGESRDPPTSVPTQIFQETALSQSSQTPPRSSQTQTLPMCTGMQTRSKLPLGTTFSQSSQILSQSLQPQTPPQRSWTQTLSTPTRMQTSSQLSQGITPSQGSQTPVQPQTQTLLMRIGMQTRSQLSQGTTFSQSSQFLSQSLQPQTSSQRSAAQTRLQQPPAKKFRMGF